MRNLKICEKCKNYHKKEFRELYKGQVIPVVVDVMTKKHFGVNEFLHNCLIGESWGEQICI